MEKDKSCAERVKKHFDGRMEDLRLLYEAFCNGEEDVPNLGNLSEYGLSFDYVAPNTFTDQEQGYFRYQLSWGGPSDEFRFFVNPNLTPFRIEYWFLDWFDGAPITLEGEDRNFMKELFLNIFQSSGTAQAELDKATEE